MAHAVMPCQQVRFLGAQSHHAAVGIVGVWNRGETTMEFTDRTRKRLSRPRGVDGPRLVRRQVPVPARDQR